MIRKSAINALVDLAEQLGDTNEGTEWHLFGSVNRGEPIASDIDLLIICKSDAQADVLRRVIDPDLLGLPLHLSLMTYKEASKAEAIRIQQASRIFPVARQN